MANEALKAAREVVDACAGDNRPAPGWAAQVRDLIDATLSSDAVAGGEPVKLGEGTREFLQNAINDATQCEDAEDAGNRAFVREIETLLTPLYAAPPELTQLQERVKELVKADETRVRDISRLMVERDAVRDALTELDQLRERVKELVKALDIAGNALDEFYRYWTGGETRGSYDGKPERDGLWNAMYAVRAARRVREGG